MKNEQGFTLIEMLIVLMIISTLLIVTIPNLASNNSMVQTKGCEAMVKLAESQVQAYQIENKTSPASIQTLVDEGYLEQATCPDGSTLSIESNGTIKRTPVASE